MFINLLKGIKLRFNKYLKKEILSSIYKSFGDVKVILFGSRVDDTKRGGDFDIAIICDYDKKEFKERKLNLIKQLFLKDIDLPIDLINYKFADDILKKEIDNKGILIK